MAKMLHDDFEAWIRDRCRGCIEQPEIDEYCKGDLDFDTGAYTFRDQAVQAQWESWQAATLTELENEICLYKRKNNV